MTFANCNYNELHLSDHENFYEGRQFGESDSHANVHLDDGVMTASIHIGDETYHVEVVIRS